MTMNHDLHKHVQRWLEAEAREDVAEAEAALEAAFADLPRLAPRLGFAERVMFAFHPPSSHLAWLWWGSRAATIGVLALVALAAALVPLERVLLELPTPGTVVESVTRGITWVAGWLSAGLEVWNFMVRIGNAIGVAMTTPQIGTVLLASALIGAAALYELNRLLVLERRTA